MRKPDGLVLAGIYEVSGGRTWICTHMEWGKDGLFKAGFYEPEKNQYNEASRAEIDNMFDKNLINLKDFSVGRKIF